MKEIIATGKTVDLAIEEACQQLGVPREKAEFEIIDLPKKGLFGLKTYPAKVRVFVKEDKAEMAVEYISSILRAMGAQSFSATPSLEGENLHITLQGDDLGFVIGRRGETIDAIQYLTSLAVNRLDGDYMRITIDSGNFREKREKTLESLAKRLARNVVRSGRSVTLEPMNPYERRIIHATVSTIEGATSSSIGEEPNRRVVISSTNPVKKNNNYKGKKKPYNNKGGRRSGSRRAEHVDQTVEKVHAAKKQKDHQDNRQSQIHAVQDPGRLLHPGHQLILLHAGHLCPHKMHTGLLHIGQHHGKHQHAHAAYPVGKASPEEHALRQSLHVRQDGRSCGGKPGNRLKKSVHVAGNASGQGKGHSAKQGP